MPSHLRSELGPENTKYDVVVIGAGTAGLVTASLLARSGKRIALVERGRRFGGRAMEHTFRGHKIGLGSHLAEDPGDSLTRVCEILGVPLVHSEPSDSMPFWDDGRWGPIQERYAGAGKTGLKRCIEALVESDWAELERWDHASLREWMSRYTSDEGAFLVWEAISVLEQITNHWYEHSASENLFARKLAYEHRRTAGYSFWPMGGWDRLWRAMADRLEELGGVVRAPERVERVLVEDGRITGVRLRDRERPGAGEVLEADEVVVSLPVWDLSKLFDEGVLPWDLLQRIKLLANNRNRACWLGYWIAAPEPVIAMTEREMASFFATPRTGLPGFTLNFTGYDPGVSPPGEYLTCVGAAFDATQHYGNRAWIARMFDALWRDIEEMLPAARGALWRKPHLVTSYGVICRPGLVGAVRPDVRVREIDGLWLAGDTTRARGIGVDKAARSGITAAEAVLGRRLPEFAGTFRY
jgi:glycine/D-amino acid oxidase-like deaminating enzyme